MNKKKIATSVAAVATAAAVLVGGTFAWQSISQTALNEASDVVNPGGRLHDDFSYTEEIKNKDVYVENFADEDIFARVRLDEYFEIVVNKGSGAAEKTEIITDGAVKDDPATYVTHLFDKDNATDAYWSWTTGGETVYMPTFNLNKDSLAADINGTYAGPDDVEGVNPETDVDDKYKDYVTYEEGETLDGTEIYDADANNIDDEAVSEVTATHAAKMTDYNAILISMDEWVNEYNSESGPYWVYDTDGWVYWAQAIKPHTATGLLLDNIQLTEVMDDSWYYAINVVGQFVTADDLGSAEDGTGFYDTTKGTAPSENALALLKTIGVDVSGETEDDGGNGGNEEEELGYIETLPTIDFKNKEYLTEEDAVTVYRGTTYEFRGNDTAWDGTWTSVNIRNAEFEGDTEYTSTVDKHPEGETVILNIAADEPNEKLILTVYFSGDSGDECNASIHLDVKDPAKPTDAEGLQEALNNGDRIDLGDTEVTVDEPQALGNFSAGFVMGEGGTINGGVINGAESGDTNSDTYTTLLIGSADTDTVNATVNDTVINSEDDFAVYIQTDLANVTLNGVTINGKFGGLLAEYNTDDSHYVDLNDVTITVGSAHETWYVNTAVAAANGAIVNVNSGTYTGDQALMVFSSGGTINVYGGYFDGKIMNDAEEKGNIYIYGGTFTVDPTEYVDTEYYVVTDNGDGTWTVEEKGQGEEE